MFVIIRGFSERGRNAGEVDERLKSHAWKACIGSNLSGVRIPLSPPRIEMRKRLPSGSLFAFLSWRREAEPLRALRGGFEGIAPAGASRSESSDCLPLRGGAPEALRAAQKNSCQHYSSRSISPMARLAPPPWAHSLRKGDAADVGLRVRQDVHNR